MGHHYTGGEPSSILRSIAVGDRRWNMTYMCDMIIRGVLWPGGSVGHVAVLAVTHLAAQRFIAHRSRLRWWMHQCLSISI
jgi:hypothetical protein